jgi:hypothetical protein
MIWEGRKLNINLKEATFTLKKTMERNGECVELALIYLLSLSFPFLNPNAPSAPFLPFQSHPLSNSSNLLSTYHLLHSSSLLLQQKLLGKKFQASGGFVPYYDIRGWEVG